MSCTCHATPHELWCAEAPQGLTLDELISSLIDFRTQLSGGHRVAIDFGGNYLPTRDARAEYHRGEFLVVMGAKS